MCIRVKAREIYNKNMYRTKILAHWRSFVRDRFLFHSGHHFYLNIYLFVQQIQKYLEYLLSYKYLGTGIKLPLR